MYRTCFVVLLLITPTGNLTTAADWPAFRGPYNSGVAAESSAPTRWGAEENIRWKAELPRPANGSPIVVQGKVFVTSAEDNEGRRRSLYCFDADNGQRHWVRTVVFDKEMPTHKTNPYCGTTPVSDGKRVVVWHASAGLYCYDLDGRELWSRNLGEFRHMWGYGSSPILHNGRVILQTGPGQRVFVTAIDLASGQTVWETDEPLEGSDRNAAGKFMGSWSSPLIARVNQEEQIIVVMPTRVNAYDPDSGKIVWSCRGIRHDRGDLSYSSPILVGDLCFVTGGFRGCAMAIRLGGKGDITQTHRLWHTEKNPQSIGSGGVVDGLVYRPNAGPSTIECVDPTTGEVRWKERAGVNHWASIVMVGGLLYATDQNTTTTIFRPNPKKLDVVAENQLPGSCNATPAVANGRIFFRTNEAVYCIGK